MRVRANVGAVGLGQQVVQPTVQPAVYQTPAVNGMGVVGVRPTTLPMVDNAKKIINIFDGVKPISAINAGAGGVYNADKAYECLITLLNMTPITPEIAIFATRLKEVGNNYQFNGYDSRSLDKVMSAVVSSALEELIDRDETKYSALMEAICNRAVTDVSVDSVSKWIGSSTRNGFGKGFNLVDQAVNAFRSYMSDNGLKGFDNINKFKKHFNNFLSKKAEYKDVLVSEAWNAYNGGVR